MKKYSWLGSAALAIFSTTIACLVGEIYVRYCNPQNLTGSSFEYDVHTGYRLQANIDVEQVFDGRRTKLRTNPMGMRQNESISSVKLPNEKRVLFLGDSFTEGVGVAFEETFVGRLQEHLDTAFSKITVRVLNSGVGGYGTQNELRFLHHYGFALNPDVVILVMGPDDVDRNLRGDFFRLLSDGTLEEQNKIAPPLLDTPAKRFVRYVPFYNFLSTHSQLFGLVRFRLAVEAVNFKRATITKTDKSLSDTKREIASSTDGSTQYGFAITKALIQQIKKECDEHSVRLFVTHVGIPVSVPITRQFVEDSHDWFKSSGIDFLDMSYGFPSDLTQFIIKGDSHFNSSGHKLFSKLLWSGLESRLRATFENR